MSDLNYFILKNARKDPAYSPYCGRCTGLVRMKKVEDFYWTCYCGAVHDIREVAKEIIDKESKEK